MQWIFLSDSSQHAGSPFSEYPSLWNTHHLSQLSPLKQLTHEPVPCVVLLKKLEHWKPAAHFFTKADSSQNRCTLSRLFLRSLFGLIYDQDPLSFEFEISPLGKPSIKPSPGGLFPPLRFNLSHSGPYYAIAFSSAPIGVDIEAWKPKQRLKPIVNRHFFSSEKNSLQSFESHANPHLWTQRALQYWTAKEALSKAHGYSVLAGLKKYEVDLQPMRSSAMYTTHSLPAELHPPLTLNYYDSDLPTLDETSTQPRPKFVACAAF